MFYAHNFCKCIEKFDTYIFVGPCKMSGKEIKVTIKAPDLYKINQGAKLQDACPYLSDDEREFLISGISGPEFDKLFKE